MAKIEVRVQLDRAAFEAYAQNPSGPVSTANQGLARQVLNACIQFIGTRYSGHHVGRGPRLADSGHVEHQGGSSWGIVFDHPIAVYHHEGTPGHEIHPKKSIPKFGGRKALARKGPGVVTSSDDTEFLSFRTVNHPGTTENRFLDKGARAVGLRPAGALKRGTTGPFPVFRGSGSNIV
jgi:hypothetical protein